MSKTPAREAEEVLLPISAVPRLRLQVYIDAGRIWRRSGVRNAQKKLDGTIRRILEEEEEE